MIAYDFQGAFAVDFLFQSPQRFVYRLAFFQFDFGQITLTSSPETLDTPDQYGRRSSLSGQKAYFSAPDCQLERGGARGIRFTRKSHTGQ